MSPLLFNLYIYDVPITNCLQFWYVDDLVLVFQSKEFEEGEENLSEDLAIINNFFKKWSLTLNLTKTEVSSFHLYQF